MSIGVQIGSATIGNGLGIVLWREDIAKDELVDL